MNAKMSNRTFFITTFLILTIGTPLFYFGIQLFFYSWLKAMELINLLVQRYF